MHTSTSTTLALLCMIIGISIAQNCGTNLQSCAGQCYNPGTASCITNKYGNQVLCGFQHLPATTPDAVCGTTCYDTADYGCCNDTDTIYQLANGDSSCPVPAPNPPASGGCASSDDCGTGLECCNQFCFNPATASCVTSSNGNPVLCGFQHLPATTPDAACNNICYDTEWYGCCASTGQIYDLSAPTYCPSPATSSPTSAPPTNSPTSPPASATHSSSSSTSQTTNACAVTADCGSGLDCCAGQCYNPATASCPISNTGVPVLCGFQHLPAQTPDAACGTHCYDTATYGCCSSTNEIYQLNNPSQCSDTVATSTTSAPTGLTAPPTTVPATSAPTTQPPQSACGCASGLECCAGQCYSPATASCPISNTGVPVLCGFQHLPATTPDAACGTHCYDTATYGCCNSTNEIFGLGDSSSCPDSVVPSTTSAPTGLTAPATTVPPTFAPTTQPPQTTCNCGSGLECCKGQCYNPGTASCVTSNTGAIVLCGFQHLPATTPDAACGIHCYDTQSFGCCNSTSELYDLSDPSSCDFDTTAPATPAPTGSTCGSTTCGTNESCCGATCYDPSTSLCISNANQQVICSKTDSACISRNGAGQLTLSFAMILAVVLVMFL